MKRCRVKNLKQLLVNGGMRRVERRMGIAFTCMCPHRDVGHQFVPPLLWGLVGIKKSAALDHDIAHRSRHPVPRVDWGKEGGRGGSGEVCGCGRKLGCKDVIISITRS